MHWCPAQVVLDSVAPRSAYYLLGEQQRSYWLDDPSGSRAVVVGHHISAVALSIEVALSCTSSAAEPLLAARLTPQNFKRKQLFRSVKRWHQKVMLG